MNVRTIINPPISFRLKTGGILNIINDGRCNKPNETVPTQRLAEKHKPTNPEEMRQLIEQHYIMKKPCSVCNCKSHGTVEMFATNLFHTQHQKQFDNIFKGEPRRSWDRCYEFHYHLFCIGPLRGISMEQKCRQLLENFLKHQQMSKYYVKHTTPEDDVRYAVDLIIMSSEDNRIVLGIQVKPESVKSRISVMKENYRKNEAWGHPVAYFFYNKIGYFKPSINTIMKFL